MSRVKDRQRLVAELRTQGLSIRTIAEELRVSHVTVLRDIRAIEQQTGELLDPGVILGQDFKAYAPKVTLQEYEAEPGFGEPAAEESLSSVDHLTNVLAGLQRAEDALQIEGVRNANVPPVLAEIRQAAAQLLAMNKKLPRPPKE
jgi:hypothetical protein